VAIDAILAGDRFVLTQVGIGPDAIMIRHTSREDQARRGRLAYITTFLQRAFRHRSRSFAITADGSVIRARAWQVIFANAGSAGAPLFQWGPGIRPHGRRHRSLRLRRAARKGLPSSSSGGMLVGRHLRDSSTRFFTVREERWSGERPSAPDPGRR
jgi:hypothetical protein